jgi:hypothetical protein
VAGADRASRFAALASGFAGYLTAQTGIEIAVPSGTGAAADADPRVVLATIERLDAALQQIIDLATAYSDDPRLTLEPLALPAAALMGEVLRAGLGAAWLDEGDEDALAIVTLDGIAIDLVGVTRAALLSGSPNLTAVARRMTSAEC